DRGQGDHASPDQAVVLARQQFDEVAGPIGNQGRIEVADFIEDLETIALDLGVIVPQVLGNLADSLAIFLRRHGPGNLLIGNLVAPVLKIGDLFEDGHAHLPFHACISAIMPAAAFLAASGSNPCVVTRKPVMPVNTSSYDFMLPSGRAQWTQ